MAFPDGRYITKAELIGWGLDNVAPESVTPVDDQIGQSIARAEAEWDRLCGSRFDNQTITNAQPFTVFVDGKGWLHLLAYEVGPVTAVTSLSIMNLVAGDEIWKTITWDAVNGIIMPPSFSPPKPNAWEVILKPYPAQLPAGTGDIYAKWTYTGGYTTIPNELKGIIARFAWWIWKLTREAPLGVVKNPMLGIVDIPLQAPPDIKSAAVNWQRQGN